MKMTAQNCAELLYRALAQEHGDHEKALVRGFAEFLIREECIGMIHDIRRRFKERVLRSQNKIGALVGTSHSDTHVVPRVVNGQSVEVYSVEDAALIGGVRVRIGDTLVDNTIARRIRNLRNALQ